MRCFLFILGMTLAVIGCAPGRAALLDATAIPEPTVLTSPTGDSGNISSMPTPSSGSEPTALPSAPDQVDAGGAPAQTTQPSAMSPTTAPAPGSWKTYQDATYGFALRYPPNYVLVPATQTQPAAALQVWFQEQVVANSPTAKLNPPQFAIDVFQNPKQLTPQEWIQSNEDEELAKLEATPVTVDGVSGIRLSNMLALAPNTFIYVAKGNVLYRFTPLGPFSQEMLDSFKFAG